MVERWDLAVEPAPLPTTVAVDRIDRRTSVAVLDDGRVLVLRVSGGRGELAVAQSGRAWRTPPMLTGYLLAAPGPDQRVFVVGKEDPWRSLIWRLTEGRPAFVPVAEVEGSLFGGVWLDGGSRLAVEHSDPSHGVCGTFVDLERGTWRRAWSVSAASVDRIVAYSPRSGRLAMSTSNSLALRYPDGRVRILDHLDGTPLAFDDSGEHLLLRQTRGATSRLAIYTPATDHVERLPGPPGTVWPPARWVGDRIHLRYAAPDQPPTLATVKGTDWDISRYPSVWAGAETVELPGATGPVETIVYGGPRWRSCRRIVVALHGGPLSSWMLDFNPLFQHLSAAGIAVVAPNYRGSVGYGSAHLGAVVGDWGGPDLADVLSLADSLDHDGLVVLGVSYGAFLALLAACDRPGLWSGCVALAGFTSAARLGAEAAPAVRDRVARLSRFDAGGRVRDVIEDCAAIRAPLLLAHGSRDEIVPVTQSRALRRRLLELGRSEGHDFDYLEVEEDHTSVVQTWLDDLREAVVRFCLGAGARAADAVKGGES